MRKILKINMRILCHRMTKTKLTTLKLNLKNKQFPRVKLETKSNHIKLMKMKVSLKSKKDLKNWIQEEI